MRLSCPNCDAQYELSDDAIPKGGRDVQCSNCGHAWFQMPPADEAAAEVEEALFEPPEDAAEAEAEPDMAATPAEEQPAVTAEDQHPHDNDEESADGDEAERFEGPAPLQRRSIDESLLSVLREEAEREAKARQAEPARGIETQTDMGLEAAVAATVSPAARRVAELKGLDLSEEDDDADAAPARSGMRRDMLPDVEEINSTLRASDDRYDPDAEVAALPSLHKRGRSSFRSGFVLMIMIATLMVLAYVMAPKIVEQIPASAGAMAAYVEIVDKARVFLDGLMQSAIGMLRGISGSEG